MKKEKSKTKEVESINKERRYLLIGMASLFVITKGIDASTKSKHKKGTGYIVFANFLWKMISLFRIIFKV